MQVAIFSITLNISSFECVRVFETLRIPAEICLYMSRTQIWYEGIASCLWGRYQPLPVVLLERKPS